MFRRLAIGSLALGAALAFGLNLAGCPQQQVIDDGGDNGSNTDGDGTNTGGDNGGSDGTIDDFLPADITLDVDELPAGSQTARATVDVYRGVTGGARDIVHMFDNAGVIVLSIGRTITDSITDPDQSQVEGQFNIDGALVDYRCDFSPYDFDGDGVLDGSGNSQEAPVAFRIWTDKGGGFDQFMCGLITVLPTNTNPGAGTIIAHPSNADDNAQDDWQVRIEWDRTDLTHKWSLAYVSGTVDATEGVILDIGYTRVDFRGSEKNVRASALFDQHPSDYVSMQSALHFQSGGNAVLFTATSTGGAEDVAEVEACRALSDFSQSGACSSFDTQDMEMLDLPIGGENDFPAGFPAAPTF